MATCGRRPASPAPARPEAPRGRSTRGVYGPGPPAETPPSARIALCLSTGRPYGARRPAPSAGGTGRFADRHRPHRLVSRKSDPADIDTAHRPSRCGCRRGHPGPGRWRTAPFAPLALAFLLALPSLPARPPRRPSASAAISAPACVKGLSLRTGGSGRTKTAPPSPSDARHILPVGDNRPDRHGTRMGLRRETWKIRQDAG